MADAPNARPIKMGPSNSQGRQSIDRRMRTKQLASTVRQGRKITIQVLDEYPFSGYLCGWDDETYFVIIPPEVEGNEPVKRLVPKDSIQFIDLVDERTFQEEATYKQMVSTVQPFRDWINNNYFDES